MTFFKSCVIMHLEMIASKEQIEERLNSKSNVIHKMHGAGRGGPTVPSALKEVAIGLRLEGEKNSEIAKSLEISPQLVSNAFNGKANLPEKSKDRIQTRKQDACDLAMDKLMDSLGLIDSEKLEDLSAVQLSVVAGNMSKVAERLEGRSGIQNNVLVVYTTSQKAESEFRVINSRE